MSVSWDLEVGDVESRTWIQSRYGGSHSRGISAPASRGVDIMLWWRPGHGEQFGYADGWARDGTFNFSGTGQTGDQRFGAPHHENGRIRDHRANGDHLRLLRYVGPNRVRYLGEFALDPATPWVWRDGPDALGRPRKIIQFRLVPVGGVDLDDVRSVGDDSGAAPADPIPPAPEVTAVEAMKQASFLRLTQQREQLTRREELQLVHRFHAWLASNLGTTATGLHLRVGLGMPALRADLWIPDWLALVEAKASAAREPIRMGLGQLLDYARYIEGPPVKCLLLPSEPPMDMLSLLDELSVVCIWEDGGSFVSQPTSFLKR